MIDAELMASDPLSAPMTKADLLSDLLASPLVRAFRYADDGPPASVAPRPRVSASPVEQDVFDGWVVATPSGRANDEWLVSYSLEPDTWHGAGVTGDAVAIAAGDEEVDAYRDMSIEEARARRRADGLASQVALQGLGADLYITERTYLHRVRWDIARGVLILTPEEALPLVGLYLRAQADFRISSHATINRGFYYLVGARELLPSAWRWMRALGQHGEPTRDFALLRLGESLVQRVERALEARDHLHVALNQPQHNDTRREVLSRLDDILVDLMGAADVAARVAHRVLTLPPAKEYQAAWQSPTWLALVATHHPPLADTVSKGTDIVNALTVLRLLRNSVHGTTIRSIALSERLTPQQSLVEIPAADVEEIVSAINDLGGEDTWGIRRVVSNRVHADAGRLVDALVPRVLDLLNRLMEATPVERLANVSLTTSDLGPPAAEAGRVGVFDEWVRTSIRWQLGF
jgi:hypothetical protein